MRNVNFFRRHRTERRSSPLRAPGERRRQIVRATGALLGAGVVAVAPAVHAGAAVQPPYGPICPFTVDDPHWSIKGGGIVAKFRVTCPHPTTILAVVVELWKCRSTDARTCTTRVYQYRYLNVVARAGTQETLYIPPVGTRIGGSGYYRAAAIYAPGSVVPTPITSYKIRYSNVGIVTQVHPQRVSLVQ